MESFLSYQCTLVQSGQQCTEVYGPEVVINLDPFRVVSSYLNEKIIAILGIKIGQKGLQRLLWQKL